VKAVRLSAAVPGKRDLFSELTDEEVARIEAVVAASLPPSET